MCFHELADLKKQVEEHLLVDAESRGENHDLSVDQFGMGRAFFERHEVGYGFPAFFDGLHESILTDPPSGQEWIGDKSGMIGHRGNLVEVE